MSRLPDTLVETARQVINHPAGRFLATPVARTNLHADLVRFLAEVLEVEEQDHLPILANSLIINVLDAHLDATYWQGREAGYGQHHHDTDGVSAT